MKCLDCGAEMEQARRSALALVLRAGMSSPQRQRGRKKELRDCSPGRPSPFRLPWRSTPHGIVPGAEKF